MNKRNATFFTIMFIIIAFMFTMTYAEKTSIPVSTPTSELPHEYRIASICQIDGAESVRITTTLGVNDRTIPVSGEEIEIGLFSSSDSDADLLIRDEKNGDWIISTFLSDGERDMDITWWRTLYVGDTVDLSKWEYATVTFAGFSDEEDPIPLFIVEKR